MWYITVIYGKVKYCAVKCRYTGTVLHGAVLYSTLKVTVWYSIAMLCKLFYGIVQSCTLKHILY